MQSICFNFLMFFNSKTVSICYIQLYEILSLRSLLYLLTWDNYLSGIRLLDNSNSCSSAKRGSPSKQNNSQSASIRLRNLVSC